MGEAKSIGGSYTPPSIKGSPKIENGVATIILTNTLGEKGKESLQTAFRNYCTRNSLQLKMFIRGCTITIKTAAISVLRDVLDWLEISKPAAAQPSTGNKPPIITKPRKRRTGHYSANGVFSTAR